MLLLAGATVCITKEKRVTAEIARWVLHGRTTTKKSSVFQYFWKWNEKVQLSLTTSSLQPLYCGPQRTPALLHNANLAPFPPLQNGINSTVINNNNTAKHSKVFIHISVQQNTPKCSYTSVSSKTLHVHTHQCPAKHSNVFIHIRVQQNTPTCSCTSVSSKTLQSVHTHQCPADTSVQS